MRKQIMEEIHTTHIGIEACIWRIRDILYWPRMATEFKQYIAKCDICLVHRSGQGKEPIVQHALVARPSWAKVGADLCTFDSRTLLDISDYYSNYTEVVRLNTTTSGNVIKEMKAVFARFWVADTLTTDNGPQFSSAKFAAFAKTWRFEHKTSSPLYPQSNGKADNAAKTVKRLFSKCKEAGRSEFQALLNWRNTPSAGMGTSPPQHLMGRRCRTLLPVAGSLLQPRKAHCMESYVNHRRHRQKNRVVRAEDQSYCDDQPWKAELQCGTRTITYQGWRNQFQWLYIDTILTKILYLCCVPLEKGKCNKFATCTTSTDIPLIILINLNQSDWATLKNTHVRAESTERHENCESSFDIPVILNTQ